MSIILWILIVLSRPIQLHFVLLAYNDPAIITTSKMAIIVGSAASAILGYFGQIYFENTLSAIRNRKKVTEVTFLFQKTIGILSFFQLLSDFFICTLRVGFIELNAWFSRT